MRSLVTGGSGFLGSHLAELFGTDQGFSIDKACRELSYEPAVGFEEGMSHVEAWLRQIKIL